MAVVDKNKLLGKAEKGGDLMVRPTTSLVGSSGGKITETSDEKDVVYTISTKLVKVDKFLKGNLDAEKAAQKKEQKQKEDELRAEQEADKEKPDDKKQEKETPKSLIPKMSFLDGIKKFLGDVLVGWVAFRLIKFLPKIVKLLKPIAAFADFVLKWGGKLLDGLVTFVDWGYKALDATKGWIGDKFGDDAAQKFESFMGNLTKVMNGVILLGMAAAKMASMGRGKGPKGPKGPKPKWRKALERRWKNSRAGQFFRNNAAARKKLIRKITRPVRRVVRSLRPQSIVQNLKKTEIGKKVTQRYAKASQQVDDIIKDPKKALDKLKKTEFGKKVTKTTQEISEAIKDPKKTLDKLKKTQAGKKVTEIAKKVDPRKWKMPQIKTPGWMKKVGGVIKQGFANADAWIKSIPAKTRQLWDEVGKKIGPYIDEIGEGVATIGKNIGAQWDETTKNMKPQKVIDDLMMKIRPAIDDVLKKSPILNKLSKGLNPKSVQGLLTKAANNPALKKIVDTLKANKGASKGMGPVDKIITALMALVDYAAFGESPINAILKGLGGLLGYGVGFSAASSVPVLGQSGIFNFMGGMAGGIAGEWLALKIAKGLAKTPLADIDDPIMGPKDIEEGRPARKLVRDPDSIIGDTEKKGPKVKDLKGGGEEEGTKEGNAENIIPLDVDSVKKKADSVSSNASYEEGAEETVVIKSGSQQDVPQEEESKTGETLTPVPVVAGEKDELDRLLYKNG